MNVLKVREVCERLRVSRAVVYRLFEQGELEGFRIGGSVRIYAASIPAYRERQSNRREEAAATPPLQDKKRSGGRRSHLTPVYPLLGF